MQWQTASLLVVSLFLPGSWSAPDAGQISGQGASPAGDPRPVSGFPEAGAAIRKLVLYFDRDVCAEMYPVYRGLARALPEDVKLVVAVARDSEREAAEFLLRAAGFAGDRFELVDTESDITVWARDRMVVLRKGDTTVIERQDSSLVDGDRQGDLVAAEVLARRGAAAEVRDEPLVFEGGNVLFTGGKVLVGRNLVDDNVGEFDGDEERLLDHLEEMFGCRPTVVGGEDDLPHVHLDMFLTVVGPDTVLLGDPLAGADYLRRLAQVGLDESLAPGFGSWSVEAQYRQVPAYEAIRRQLAAAGLRVLRVPILHGEPDAVVTWNNALTELREDGVHAYVPVYGLPLLDDRALEVYRQAGCRVHPIDVSGIASLGGTVRCVTNVLDWRVPAAR